MMGDYPRFHRRNQFMDGTERSCREIGTAVLTVSLVTTMDRIYGADEV